MITGNVMEKIMLPKKLTNGSRFPARGRNKNNFSGPSRMTPPGGEKPNGCRGGALEVDGFPLISPIEIYKCSHWCLSDCVIGGGGTEFHL